MWHRYCIYCSIPILIGVKLMLWDSYFRHWERHIVSIFSYFHVYVLCMWCVCSMCGHTHVHVEAHDWCWESFWIALPLYQLRQGYANQTQSSTIWPVSLVSLPGLCLLRLELSVLSHIHTAYVDSGDLNSGLLACLASVKCLTAEPSP